MNYPAILKSIKASNGASYNLHTGTLNPSSGFMVALQGMGHVYDVPTTPAELYNHVVDYLLNKKMWSEIKKNPDHLYLGFWVNENKLWIDLAENIPDRELAIATGFKRKELAIHDCKAKQDIKLILA